MSAKKAIQTIGRRKCALARATLLKGTGKVLINQKLIENMTPFLVKERLMEPIQLAGDTMKEVDIFVNVNGGGIQGQTDASRVAITKALTEYNKKLKPVFLSYDRMLLISDTRIKEQRKPNDSRARAARQKSYR